ncbi:hypothetical protein GBA52_000825 [Prunus armeniaca]|nr:hypothetical protein GBA52_000825 [Prunus armeniaca]
MPLQNLSLFALYFLRYFTTPHDVRAYDNTLIISNYLVMMIRSVMSLCKYREHNCASVHARTYFQVAICSKLGESSKRTDVRLRFDGNVVNKSQVSNRVVVILIGKRREVRKRGGRPYRTTLKNCFDLPS